MNAHFLKQTFYRSVHSIWHQMVFSAIIRLMTTELYLTAAERGVFDSLGADLQEGWSVVEETQESYESDRQIKMRYHLADFTAYPEVQELARKFAEGEQITQQDIQNIPAGVQQELYFIIGAKGVSALIGLLLQSLDSDEVIEAVAALSTVRHELLRLNASATHS